MKRIAFVVYFSENNSLDGYVEYFLGKIRPLYHTVIIISNSALNEHDRACLLRYGDEIIERENTGYDFAAWAAGIRHVGWKSMTEYDHVTLMNTTCFGPIFPLEPIYRSMESEEIDFWGMTNFRRTGGIDWYPGGTIPEHIQSYFLSFRSEVVSSQVFRAFIREVSTDIPRDDVIINYETKLTEKLTRAGYHYRVVFDTIDLLVRDYIDYSRYDAGACIEAGVPLVKIKAFIPENNRRQVDLLQLIKQRSCYSVHLITQYFQVHNLEVAQSVTGETTRQKLKRRLRDLAARGFR